MSKTITGAQATVETLRRHGVRCVFGLCGHTNVAVLAALETSPVRFVGVHHEQMASHAADGFTRATGEVGVVLTHLGPGLTNALTGVANAALDAVPMIVISGNVQSYFMGRHAHMESTLHGDADQAASYAPFCKRTWRVERPEALVPALEAAFRTATNGLPGPVLVDVAMDVFSQPVELGEPQPPMRLARPSLEPVTAQRIAETLRAADRPLIYAGGGVVRARAAELLVELAERLNAPVAFSQMAKAAIADAHPLCVGMSGLWGTPAANEACRRADVILAVGTRFAELETSSWQPGTTFAIPPTRLLHVHIDPSELGRSYPAEIAAVADEKEALRAILACEDGERPACALPPDLEAMRTAFEAETLSARASAQYPLHPARLVADVTGSLPPEAILFGDTGWNKNGVAQQAQLTRPDQFHAPGGYATMGFGPAAALGAALAEGRRAVALVGDGAFLANLSVVVTAVEERLPVVWVVMNNGTYATISGMQRRHFASEYGSSFDASGLDYVAFARSVGADGARVERVDAIPELVDRALAAQAPFVLDIPCSRENVPTTGHWDINDLFQIAVEVRS